MNPPEEFRGNSPDDIPVARRTYPLRKDSLFSTNVVFVIFISLVSITVIFLSNFLGIKSIVYRRILPSGLANNSLLGHYPYPEASLDNLVTVYPGLEVHKDVVLPLEKMRNAAANDGVRLVLLSGFRSVELQEQIFYENKSIRNQIAAERASVSAPPGYSEHSTGYAIDFGDAVRRDTDFEVEFEETSAFKWLERNAAKYHFMLSFPKGNSQKVSYEPWHWRYEGSVEALEKFRQANQKLIQEKSNNE